MESSGRITFHSLLLNYHWYDVNIALTDLAVNDFCFKFMDICVHLFLILFEGRDHNLYIPSCYKLNVKTSRDL